MRGFKKREWTVLILEAALFLLLFLGYQNVLTNKAYAWSRKVTDDAGEKGKSAKRNQEQKVLKGSEDELGEKKIAITFDDGPHPVYTEKLLDGLKKRGIKATFFVLGERAKKNPEIIKRMLKEGHIIGNHTYSHMQLRSSNREKFREELLLTNQVISEITGEEVQYVRPPYGTWDKKLEAELSMFPVFWSVDPNDWCSTNAKRVTKSIVSKAKENSIILLHDCYQSSVEAALSSIDILMEKGFQFVTVEEILFE